MAHHPPSIVTTVQKKKSLSCSSIMSQKGSGKKTLLHPIENRRCPFQTSKDPNGNLLPSQNNAGMNTEQIQLNHDMGTNTPHYAEQIARAMDTEKGADEMVQMLIEADASEAYWKLVTERRRRAIQETTEENEQLHGLIDDLSKENEELRAIAHQCDYLQNVLEKLTADRDSLFDDTHDDDNPSD